MINRKALSLTDLTLDRRTACGYRRPVVSMEPNKRVPDCPEPGHRGQKRGCG